jgi:predicted ArsR family transcriptional regulator
VTPTGQVELKDIIEYVNDNDGVTVADVAEWFGMSHRHASRHMLAAYNTLRVERDDRFWPHRYFPLVKQPLAPGIAYVELVLRLTRIPKRVVDLATEMDVNEKRTRKMLVELQAAGLAECVERGAWRSVGLKPKEMVEAVVRARGASC